MKKLLLIVGLAFATLCCHAQKTNHTFLLQEEVPNSLLLLPPPPTEHSAAFLYDQYRYFWGKTQRNTPRGDMAWQDCDYSTTGFAAAFSGAFGHSIDSLSTPELYRLLSFMIDDAGWWGTDIAKNHYKRIRPYRYYQEPSCKPEEEKGLADNGSYPSGHTAAGFAVALVLAEINTDNQDTILRRGYAIGESRVICGYHWQSDVNGGYLMAAAVVARLHADEAFSRQLLKAKQEYLHLKKQGRIAPVAPSIR